MKKKLGLGLMVFGLGFGGYVAAGDEGTGQADKTSHPSVGFTTVIDPHLGPAVRDPNGVVWGDLVIMDENNAGFCVSGTKHGEPCRMTEEKAEEYCDSKFAKLPTQKHFAEMIISLGGKLVANGSMLVREIAESWGLESSGVSLLAS